VKFIDFVREVPLAFHYFWSTSWVQSADDESNLYGWISRQNLKAKLAKFVSPSKESEM
jgi:hypothetical protein